MEDKWIQILKFNIHKKIFEFSDELDKILLSEEIRNCEIGVISIVGGSQTGKTTLMNFFLKYLQAEPSQREFGNWLNNEEILLSECNANEVDGIWIWSKLFTKILPDGKQIRVMLMDTQTSSTTIRDFLLILQMSTMLSSVQIFNMSTGISDADFDNLKFFTDYGNIALKHSALKPLHSMVFLMRDTTGARTGSLNGRAYLHNSFQILSNERLSWTQCFKYIDCFIMSTPLEGNKVLGKCISTKFKDCLIEFIPMILINVETKDIEGMKMNGESLLQFFKLYLVQFSNNVTAKNLYELTNCELCRKEAIQIYNCIMNTISESKIYIEKKAVEDCHNLAKEKALTLFNNSVGTFSKNLRKSINNILRDYFQKQFYFYLQQNEEKIESSLYTQINDNQRTHPSVGIDFGTTYVRVAVFQNDRFQLIENIDGNFATPSYVAFSENDRLIGDTAKDQVSLNTHNTLYDIKRMLGRRFNDPKVQDDIKHWPFEVVSKDEKLNLQVEFKGQQKKFIPEEITAMILIKIMESAEQYLKKTVSRAVITVPSYFSQSQKQAILDSANIAGISIKIVNEQIAAAVAFSFYKKSTEKQNILVFDLGGGTFDVTILMIENGKFNIKSTAGDTHLGGIEFDDKLFEYFAQEIQNERNINILNDKSATQRLREACQKAKKTLSAAKKASIQIYNLLEEFNFKSTITRAQFEEMSTKIFDRIMDTVELAVANAKMGKDQINEIVLIGGSTRIPKLQALLQQFFDGKKLNMSVNPDEAVVHGAAILAANINGNKPNHISHIVTTVQPFDLILKINSTEETLMIEKNTPIPIECTTEFNMNNNITLIEVIEGNENILKIKIANGGSSIKTTLKIDYNGFLNIKIWNNNESFLLPKNINNKKMKRMINNIKEFCQEDENQKKKILIKNRFETSLFQLKSILNSNSVSLSEFDTKKINDKYIENYDWSLTDPWGSIIDCEQKCEEMDKLHNEVISHCNLVNNKKAKNKNKVTSLDLF